MFGEIALDRALDLERSDLRRAGRKAELDARRALVLSRQETGRETHEQQDQQHNDERVAAKEQPFAIDHFDDRFAVANDAAIERPVEPVLARVDRMAERGNFAVEQVGWRGAVPLGAQQGRGQRRAEDQRDEHR